MNTFQGRSAFVIQYSVTILSIHIVTEDIGLCFSARQTFLTSLTAICPLTNPKRAMEVLRLDILDLDVKIPFIVPVMVSTATMVLWNRLGCLQSANLRMWMDFVLLHSLFILRGTCTFLSCPFHLNHFVFKSGETSSFHPFFLLAYFSVKIFSFCQGR